MTSTTAKTTSKRLNIVVLGVGTVCRGLLRLLIENANELKTRHIEICILGIASQKRGSLFSSGPTGLDLEKILSIIGQPNFQSSSVSLLDAYSKGDIDTTKISAPPVWEMIKQSATDALVELTPTNLTDGEPAFSYIKEALLHKKHVSSANKGPFVFHFQELHRLAKQNNVHLGFETTVMSGTQVLSTIIQDPLKGFITKFRGIVNGTCNYILTKMASGESFESALANAKKLGYAEKDPSYDIKGLDSHAKNIILANTIFEADISFNHSNTTLKGINHLTTNEVKDAKSKGMSIKLVIEAERKCEAGQEQYFLSTNPVPLKEDDPLFHVQDSHNAILFYSKHFGETLVTGPGAGEFPTAFGILKEIVGFALDK